MKRLFENPWPHEKHGFFDILKWKMKWGMQESPVLPKAGDEAVGWSAVTREEMSEPIATGWKVTWLGHASFLLRSREFNLLIDPVFADFCAPVPIPSLRRRVPPPCAMEDLPRIDLILLTHTHYDHLDLTSLRKIGCDTRIVIAEGHASWLRGKGFIRVSELAWHESLEIFPDLKITAAPAQHFTARTPWDRDHGHWCGYVIEGSDCKLWHAGDSGYCPAFQEIGERYGPLDFGMIPIGAYMPRRIMKAMHMNPAEAVQAYLDSRCRRAVAMHWGTFRLTDEPMAEPSILLRQALEEHSLAATDFCVGKVGESWIVSPAAEIISETFLRALP